MVVRRRGPVVSRESRRGPVIRQRGPGCAWRSELISAKCGGGDESVLAYVGTIYQSITTWWGKSAAVANCPSFAQLCATSCTVVQNSLNTRKCSLRVHRQQNLCRICNAGALLVFSLLYNAAHITLARSCCSPRPPDSSQNLCKDFCSKLRAY